MAGPTIPIPTVSDAKVETVADVMTWVQEHVVLALPDAEWIEERFLQRTLNEILEDGFTLSYAPCTDRLLVAAAILAAGGVESTVVLHDSPSGSWHLLLEIETEDADWVWADFGTHESRLLPGRYKFALLGDTLPRVLRIGAPRYTDNLWDSRPPLKFLNGLGVHLVGRMEKFLSDLEEYRTAVEVGTATLDDTLVRRPEDSKAHHAFEQGRVLTFEDADWEWADLTSFHLYLEPQQP